MTLKSILLFVLTASCMLAMAGDAFAQKRGAKVNTSGVAGEVTAVGNGMIQVKGKHDGFKWVIKPGGISKYLGTAPKEWLRPGMVVMVTNSFDRKGVASVPVAMIQAFTPRPGRVIGVVADPSGLGAIGDKTAPKSFIVSGPIKSIEDGNLVIMGGRKTFTVPMAEDTEVTVDLIGDLTWVKAGDSIECKVKYMQKGQGLATEMTVTGKEAIVPPPPAPLSKKELRIKAMREKKAAAAKAAVEQAAVEEE